MVKYMWVEDDKAGTASSCVLLTYCCVPFHASCAACSIVVEHLLPALKGLTSLSTLQLSTLGSVAPLALLPTSLVALHLSVVTPETETDGSDDDLQYRSPAVPEVVQMSYLTQCTSITGMYSRYRYVLKKHMAEPEIRQEKQAGTRSSSVCMCLCAP